MTRPTEFSSANECSAVELNEVEQVCWLVSELVIKLLRFSPCELLPLEAGS
jgi:hypothetical protein